MRKLFSLIAAAALMMPGIATATDEAFLASITVYSPIVITETSALNFGVVTASPVAQTVTVAPADAGAASFNIAGQSGMPVTASVVETSLIMSNGATSITVDGFTYGGGLSAAGTATIGAQGSLSGAAVGASATVPANPAAGTYSGNLTFRVVYQ